MFLIYPLSGLDPDKNVSQYLMTHWDTANGLPSNMIIFFEQTSDGYLWIAHSKGLARFDGSKFIQKPFTSEPVNKFVETDDLTTIALDHRGFFWIGSLKGLMSYDFKTGAYKLFNKKDGIDGLRIRHIKEDMRSNLWVSTWSGPVYRISRQGKIKVFNSKQGLKEDIKINTIIETQKGNLLFASRENGFYRYRGDKFFEYPLPEICNHTINTAQEDKKGILWIGTTNGLFSATGEKTRGYTPKEGLSDNYISSIKEDSDGNIWVGTKNGLNRIKKMEKGGVDIQVMLPNFFITSIFEDREKNLWVGTYKSGIIRIKNSSFITYAPVQTLEKEVLMSLFEDKKGDVWIGSIDGKLYRCRGKEFIEKFKFPELMGTGITAISEDRDGKLWLGTNGNGAFLINKGTLIRFSTEEGLPHNTINSITLDSRGNLWFSTYNGIGVYKYPKGFFKTVKSKDGLAGKIVYNIYEDSKQNIWVGTDEGLTFISHTSLLNSDENSSTKKPDNKKENALFPPPKLIFKDTPVTCIYEDPYLLDEEGTVFWVGTQEKGLKRFSFTVNEPGKITSFDTGNGMLTNSIFQFFEDPNGYFWLMSDKGILRLDKTQLEQVSRGELNSINCISYGISDGLNSLEFNNRLSKNSVLKSGSNGELWFITSKGISIINPGKVKINKTPPTVFIEKILFNNEKVSRQSTGKKKYTFKGKGDIFFQFTAPTFISPEKIRFKYRLQGFDEEWKFLQPGAERIASYQALDTGSYTFIVTASNAEGVWNPTGASLSFAIKPLFHHTLIFKGMVTILAIILVGAITFIYKKRPFNKKKKYQGISMEPQFAEICIKRLYHLMESERIYRESELTLQSLAKMLSIQPYQLSQLLNEKLERSFSDYVNYYRIEEAKQILTGPKSQEMKNTTIAFDVGFNSMTAFYKAFKKYTGKTPSQFKKKN